MKRTIAVLLSFIMMLTITAAPVSAMQEDVKAVYINELKWLSKAGHTATYSDGVNTWSEPCTGDTEVEYCAYDINKDGYKELCVKIGCCEADYTYKFYSCEYGKIVYLGEADASHSALYECDINGIFIHQGHMGFETLTRVSKNGHSLTSTQIFEYDLYPLLEKGIDADYHYPEKYIEMYKADDYSGLY